jgi:hypothetical protein
VLLFYGLGWPLLAVAGFVAARREARARTWRLLVAWAAAFALLLALRAFGFGLFKDLKELTFVAPLVALTAGLTLARLVHTRLALMILLLLMGAWTAQSYASYWNDARAPVMIPLETSGVR